MSDARRYVGGVSFQLSGGGAIAGATSITVNNFVDADGNALTMASSFGTKGYGTLQPSTASFQEFITFTGVTDNGDGTSTLSGVSTQLAQYPYTETSGLALSHPGASTFIVSNTPGFYDNFANKNDDETIAGYWTLSQAPASPANALGVTELPNLGQVTALINGGTISIDTVIVAGTAGETITKDQLVYLKVADGKWWLCDADTAATVENIQLGLAQGGGTAGAAITNGVLISGKATLTAFTLTAATLYYASNTAGALSSSAGTTSKVVGMTPAGSTTTFYFNPNYTYIPTALEKAAFPSTGEKQAMAGGATFGTPSSSNKFITQDYNSSATGLPVVRVYASSYLGSSTTRFDVTNPAGSTYRYTYDGTGTDPGITAVTVPTGTIVVVNSSTMSAGNNGRFTVTGSGSNYFEVSNASGVAENDKTLGTARALQITPAPSSWPKPAGLKYIRIWDQAGGGGGAGNTTINQSAGGGGGGGFAFKEVAAASLGATETVTVGSGGCGGAGALGAAGQDGQTSSFGSHCVATGGTGALASSSATALGGTGGSGTTGDWKIDGGDGAGTNAVAGLASGRGGASYFGRETVGIAGGATDTVGVNAHLYGAGGSGAYGGTGGGGDTQGGMGSGGIIIVEEYYS